MSETRAVHINLNEDCDWKDPFGSLWLLETEVLPASLYFRCAGLFAKTSLLYLPSVL